jgi:hypothetical protein
MRGRAWLQSVPDYTAVFHKQERVADVLCEPDTIDLKLRHSPFSVAMSWRENGRVVIYCDGFNENRITVRLGGWKRRLGWFHLDPHSTLAMQEARYPVTDVGLLRLTDQLLERFQPYLDRTDGVQCEWLADQFIGGRLCRVFEAEYASSAVNPDYRKSILWLDREWSVPLDLHDVDFTVEGLTTPPPEVAAAKSAEPTAPPEPGVLKTGPGVD